MEGFDLFMKEFKKLNFKDRKESIRKIFGLKRIILYTIDDEESEKIFRIYDGDRYYKFIIYFENSLEKYMYKINVRDIYINCQICVLNYNIENDFLENRYFSKFMRILKYSDIKCFEFF